MRPLVVSQAILIALLGLLFPSICTAFVVPGHRHTEPTVTPAVATDLFLKELPAATSTSTTPPSTFSTSTLRAFPLEKKWQTTLPNGMIIHKTCDSDSHPCTYVVEHNGVTKTLSHDIASTAWKQIKLPTTTTSPASTITTPPPPPLNKKWETTVGGVVVTNPSDIKTSCSTETASSTTASYCGEWFHYSAYLDGGLGIGGGIFITDGHGWVLLGEVW